MTTAELAGEAKAFIEAGDRSDFLARTGRYMAEAENGAVVRIPPRYGNNGKVLYLTDECPPGLEPVAHLIPPRTLADGSPAPPEGFKRCSACREDKPATDEFFPPAHGRLDSNCRECKRAATRDYNVRAGRVREAS